MKTIVSTQQGTTACKLLKRSWEGKIIFVSHGGWYIETDHKEILMLYDAKLGEIPIGVAIPNISALPYDKRLERNSVRFVNNQIALPMGLQIEVIPQQKRYELSVMSELPEWIETLKYEVMNYGKGGLRYTVCEGASDARSLMQDEITRRIGGLISVLKANNLTDTAEKVKSVLGLGTGLTPSCDDWLVGYMYASARTGKMESFNAVSGAVQKYSAAYTNDISAAYLGAAARGEYFEVLENCLFNKCTDCISRLLNIGGSSGSDMLSGMIAACAK